MKRLDSIRPGEQCQIESVQEKESVSQRLMALGLLPGVALKVIGVAPLGDPMTVEFGFSRLSLRKSEAAVIAVQPCQSVSQ